MTNKLSNDIQPTTNILSLVHQTIKLLENIKEPTYNKTDKTIKLPKHIFNQVPTY